jgi:hypothetical protein
MLALAMEFSRFLEKETTLRAGGFPRAKKIAG